MHQQRQIDIVMMKKTTINKDCPLSKQFWINPKEWEQELELTVKKRSIVYMKEINNTNTNTNTPHTNTHIHLHLHKHTHTNPTGSPPPITITSIIYDYIPIGEHKMNIKHLTSHNITHLQTQGSIQWTYNIILNLVNLQHLVL